MKTPTSMTRRAPTWPGPEITVATATGYEVLTVSAGTPERPQIVAAATA